MSRVTYHCHEGQSALEALNQLASLNQDVFALNESSEALRTFLESRLNTFVVLALSEAQCVGFKIGFQYSPAVFESWRGGVHHQMRKQGIATTLMDLQHSWVQKNGFRMIRTVTDGDNQAMLILNLKHGFTIVDTMMNQSNRSKVVLQKHLQIVGDH